MNVMVVSINTELVEISTLYRIVQVSCGNKDHLFSRFGLVIIIGAHVPLLVSHGIVARGGRDTGN